MSSGTIGEVWRADFRASAILLCLLCFADTISIAIHLLPIKGKSSNFLGKKSTNLAKFASDFMYCLNVKWWLEGALGTNYRAGRALCSFFFLQKIEQNSRSITPALLVGSTVHCPRGYYGTSIVTLKQGSKFFPLTVQKLNQLYPVKSWLIWVQIQTGWKYIHLYIIITCLGLKKMVLNDKD